MWKVSFTQKPKLTKPLLIEGLPGVGNVAKIAADFAAEQVGAELCATFTSDQLRHAVFVNDKNLVEPPVIELYCKKRPKQQDLLFLLGDVQPFDEEGALALGEAVLKTFKQFGGVEVLTLGGVATEQEPKTPKVYCTGTQKKIVGEYGKLPGVTTELYGVVGPIVGITGVLLGLAGSKKIPAVTLLAETHAHPAALGVAGGKKLVDVLAKRLKTAINTGLLAESFELPKFVTNVKGHEENHYIG
jgi:hypothetical protein